LLLCIVYPRDLWYSSSTLLALSTYILLWIWRGWGCPAFRVLLPYGDARGAPKWIVAVSLNFELVIWSRIFDTVWTILTLYFSYNRTRWWILSIISMEPELGCRVLLVDDAYNFVLILLGTNNSCKSFYTKC
jgi:hypothetical protein